jgi:membrane protease YdiL (CAAX protease family)
VSHGPVTSPPPAPPPAAPGGGDEQRPFLQRYVGLPANGFNWTTAVIAFFTAFVAQAIGIAIVVAAIDPDYESNASKLAAQAIVVLSFIGAAVVVAAVDAGEDGGSFLDRFGLRRFGLWMLGIAGLAWLGYFIVQLGLQAIISPEQKDVTDELGTNEDSVLSIAATALLVVPGAAIAEEMLFRGVIFSGLRRSMSLWPAAAISSVVWALLHLVSGNIAVAAVLAVFGLTLAWAYERSGSLWTPICAHAFNNTLAVLALFLT